MEPGAGEVLEVVSAGTKLAGTAQCRPAAGQRGTTTLGVSTVGVDVALGEAGDAILGFVIFGWSLGDSTIPGLVKADAIGSPCLTGDTADILTVETDGTTLPINPLLSSLGR
jgi:hypothetical protein